MRESFYSLNMIYFCYQPVIGAPPSESGGNHDNWTESSVMLECDSDVGQEGTVARFLATTEWSSSTGTPAPDWLKQVTRNR